VDVRDGGLLVAGDVEAARFPMNGVEVGRFDSEKLGQANGQPGFAGTAIAEDERSGEVRDKNLPQTDQSVLLYRDRSKLSSIEPPK
jgi:hypothetical protein